MILIDEDAENELVAFMEEVTLNPVHAMRCIHFQCLNRAALVGLKEVVIASAQQHLPTSNPRIFFCGMGDIIIIAEPIPSRDGNRFILDVVEHVKMPADESWVAFDELARMIGALSVRIEPTIEEQRKAQEAARKLQEQQQQVRKREAILHSNVLTKSPDIQLRRNQRASIELMMIEDDAFSRRLVENVLQKKYALTSLSDANHALETYARIAPDLLFLDINLPDVTGHELLERLLAIDPHAHVIMLSGNADQANIIEAMRTGAKGFIAKPFTKEKLFQYIDRCVETGKGQHSRNVP